MKNWMKHIAIVTCITFAWTAVVYPLPQNLEVVSGDADVQVDGSTMVINASDGTIINYSSFDIGEGENVIINLPDASSEILNRVIGGDFTTIAGALQSNGICILINESGIYVAPTGTIDAAGLILSTRDIANQDFLDGEHLFQQISTDEFDSLIKNSGTITLSDGGFGVMVAGAVENEGTIIANVGRIVLATGEAIRIDIADGGLISVAIEKEQAKEILDKDGNPVTDQIKNTGNIEADGGIVMFKAESLADIFEKAINLEGIVRANAFDEAAGFIAIESNKLREYEDAFEYDETANVYLGGELLADTGEIVIEANHGGIYNSGTIDTQRFTETGYTFKSTGTLLGGGYNYDNLDGAAYISGNIGADQSDAGNLIVDDDITLVADDLTFTADSNTDGSGVFSMQDGTTLNGGGYDLTIVSGTTALAGAGIDGQVARLETLSNLGRLQLNSSTGSSAVYNSIDPLNDTWDIDDFRIGSNTKVKRFSGAGTGSGDPYMIYDVYGLQSMQGYLSSYFKLAQNVDASGTSGWNSGSGFDPVGNASGSFAGTFDGDGKIISDLYINRTTNYCGLFGYTNASAEIRDIGVVNIDYTNTGSYAGGLVGLNYGTISESYVVGEIIASGGNSHASGGFVGSHRGGAITNSYADVDITASNQLVGGFVGWLRGATISDSYAIGDVSSSMSIANVGGFVGNQFISSTISRSYATGDVTSTGGSAKVGGFSGSTTYGSINNSYSTGSVTGSWFCWFCWLYYTLELLFNWSSFRKQYS